MKSVEFCYWLQGFFEVANPKSVSDEQLDMIKRHLDLVFIHEIDPSYPEYQQEKLNEVHAGSSSPLHSKKPGQSVSVPRC